VEVEVVGDGLVRHVGYLDGLHASVRCVAQHVGGVRVVVRVPRVDEEPAVWPSGSGDDRRRTARVDGRVRPELDREQIDGVKRRASTRTW
jgi:hypothetical protein